MVFLGIILKKSGVTLFFQESLEIRGYSEKILKKNEILAFFHVLIQESECTFGISVTIA